MTRASTCSNTRASTSITTCAVMVLNGASTCSNTCASTCITTRASTCITTRASTCHYTRARLLFKNMRPGGALDFYINNIQRRQQLCFTRNLDGQSAVVYNVYRAGTGGIAT